MKMGLNCGYFSRFEPGNECNDFADHDDIPAKAGALQPDDDMQFPYSTPGSNDRSRYFPFGYVYY